MSVREWPRDRPRLVYVASPMRRCGTTFVARLIALHPDVTASPAVGEDHALESASHLERFADDVTSRFRGRRQPPPESRRRLMAAAGGGLVDFLCTCALDAERPVIVAKTPAAAGVETFQDLFPVQCTTGPTARPISIASQQNPTQRQ